jgi:hypothetical protein
LTGLSGKNGQWNTSNQANKRKGENGLRKTKGAEKISHYAVGVLLAAAAFNFKKWMNKIRKEFLRLFYFLIFTTSKNQMIVLR